MENALAMPAEEAARLGLVGDRLADLLIAEAAMVRAGRAREIASLQTEKLRLAAAWSRGAQAIRATPPAPDEGRALAAVAARLDAAAARSEVVLRAARDASERVLGAIARGVAETRGAVGLSYAQAAPAASRRAAGTNGIALDRSC